MLNKNQKLGLGVFILLIVDIIWVASSELTKVSFYCLFAHQVNEPLKRFLFFLVLVSRGKL